ncbi:MAG: TonB-dependent receptor [Verrucomicrobiales bacterium]|nr:TonB-dependent receptor [Verrucomicrobiales bacterium]
MTAHAPSGRQASRRRLPSLRGVWALVGLGLAATAAVEPAPVAAAGEPDFTALSLEELGAVVVPTVVGASKYAQKASDAPSSVSVVTRQDIREYGYRTLSEILAGVRGLYVTTDRAYQFLGIRGINRLGDYGGRTLLNIDGHRLNEPIYDSAFLGQEFPLDVDLIERVEVIRGPGSALYGNNAFFGVVNVVTRDPGGFGDRGVEASTSYGSFDTFTARASTGQVFTNGVEVLLSASYLESDGAEELHYPPSVSAGFPGRIERGHDGTRAGNFFASTSYRGFTLEGLYGRRDKELANGGYGALFGDERNVVWDERAYLEGRFEREFGEDWRLTSRVYVDRYAYDGTYALDMIGDGTVTLNRDVPIAHWWGGEVQVDKRWTEKHRTTAGVEGRHDFAQHQHNYDIDPAVVYMDSTKSVYTVGTYLQDEYTVLDELTLNAGVRYDYFRTVGDTLNPRGGVLYRPWTTSTLKALYGQAYRVPNAFEYDFEDAVFYKANPSLDPERIRSYELAWEQAIGRNYRLTGTVFLNAIENLITQYEDPDPADDRLVFGNTDEVEVRGVEFEFEGKWEHGLRARASYALADAEDKTASGRPNNSPMHVGTLRVTLPVWPGRVFAGVELQAIGDRETAYGNRLPAQVQTHLTLSARDIVDGLDLSASLYNLFDRDDYDPAAPDFVQELHPRDGLTFRIKATYRF